MKYHLGLCIILWFYKSLTATFTFGQIANSPYSSQGYGEPHFTNNVREVGMSGLSTVDASPLFINQQNPALLQHNKLTIFDAGLFVEQRNSTWAHEKLFRSYGGNLMYLALGFPVSSRWTTSFQLSPLSYVNYQNRRVVTIDGADYSSSLLESQAEGGISHVSWANGFGIDKKGKISVGTSLGYAFGNLIYQSYSQIIDSLTGLDNMRVGIYEKLTLRGLVYKGGFFLTDTIFRKTSLNIGFTATNRPVLHSFFQRQTERSTNIYTFIDTLAYQQSSKFQLPEEYQLGLALERKYYYLIGTEVGIIRGENFLHPTRGKKLRNGYFVNIGGEYTPNFQSVTSYFKRVTYRGGFRYIQHPWYLNNESIQEINFSAGITFPMPNFASFNFATVVGVRAYHLTQGVKENFFRFCLGITINERWFVRRRFD